MSEVETNPTQSELAIVKEFCESNLDVARHAGRLVIRSKNYGSSLRYFDQLFETMEDVASRCEPPFDVDRTDTEVVHYGGQYYKNTFGLETNVPIGTIVPDDCTRITMLEQIK
jgi:hypothetical protein